MRDKRTGARQSRCRACQKIASRAHYEANKAEVKARSKANRAVVRGRLQPIVDAALAAGCCASCGTNDNLTFMANREYQGIRVSAALGNAHGEQTLREAMANSTIMCKKCEGLVYIEALRPFHVKGEAREAMMATAKHIDPNEYKRRRTGVQHDRRTSALR